MSERTSHTQNLSSLFSQVLQQLNMNSSPEWLQLDLTFQQMKVLYILRQEGSLKMSTLHQKLGVTMPTITGIVNRLIERRDGVPLLARENSPDDRRQVWARLTPEGLEVTEMLNELNSKLLEQAIGQLSDGEVTALETNLSRFLEALNSQSQAEEAKSEDGNDSGSSGGRKAGRRLAASKDGQASTNGHNGTSARRYDTVSTRPVVRS